MRLSPFIRLSPFRLQLRCGHSDIRTFQALLALSSSPLSLGPHAFLAACLFPVKAVSWQGRFLARRFQRFPKRAVSLDLRELFPWTSFPKRADSVPVRR